MEFGALVETMAEAAQRMVDLGAVEGGAGNLSLFTRDLAAIDARYAERGRIVLPLAVPALADGWLLVTGTGCRLRDITRRPETVVCLVHVLPEGREAVLYAVEDIRPTSEFNSHLAIHADHVARRGLAQHAVLHAQPFYLTYLSHHPDYADTRAFSRRLLRWQPETLMVFPDGIGLLPFAPPGSPEQMALTVRGLQTHRAVVWAKHGVVTRSDVGLAQAADLVEYAEAAAHYEALNLALGRPTVGMSDAELRLLAARFSISQVLF